MEADKLDLILKKLDDLGDRVTSLENKDPSSNVPIEANHRRGNKEESFREFFLNYKTKKDTDKTLLIIFFLETRRNLQQITTKEIAEGFREIRETPPKNIADKIQLLDKRGFLRRNGEIRGLKCWLVSQSGENYLEKLGNGKA